MLLEDHGLSEEYYYVETCLMRYSRYLRIAASLLDFVKPKRLFLVSAYGPKMRALLKIANSREIETIECQHGSIHRYHPAYVFGDRNLTASSSLLPSQLLVFGQYFKDVLDTYSAAYSRGRVAVLGYAFLEAVAELSDRPNVREAPLRRTLSILVTSHSSHTSEMLPFVLHLARRRPDVEFTYKLHPGERPQDEQFQMLAEQRNIRVISDYRVSVYDLFMECHVHVSVSSTCSFEALRFGIPSILLDLGEDSLPIAALIDNETCKSVPNDAVKFFEVVEQFTQQGDALRDACQRRSAYFFARDYEERLARLYSD